MKTPNPSLNHASQPVASPQPNLEARAGSDPTLMGVGASVAVPVESSAASLFTEADFASGKPAMPPIKEAQIESGVVLSLEGHQGFTVHISKTESRFGYQARMGHTTSANGIELEQAKAWGANLIKAQWEAYVDGPSVPKALESLVENYAEKHGVPVAHLAKSVDRVQEWMAAKDFVKLGGMLRSTDNKVSRAAFEHFTGLKLPGNQVGTVAVVREWIGEEAAVASEEAWRKVCQEKAADEGMRSAWNSLRVSMRQLDDLKVRRSDKSVVPMKQYLDELLGEGRTIRFKGEGATETVDLVHPDGSQYAPFGKDRDVRCYLHAVQDGKVKNGKIVPGLTPEWKDGVKAALEFVKSVNWEYDADCFAATASEDLRAKALEAANPGRVGQDLFRQGFLHRLGFPLTAGEKPNAPEVAKAEPQFLPQPERVPGGGYPFYPKGLADSRAWAAIRKGEMEPSPDQRQLLDSAARALDAGIFYEDVFWEFVKKDVPQGFFSDEDLVMNTINTVNGNAGYEAYQARKVVEHWREKAANVEAAKHLSVGDTFRDVRLNGETFSKLTIDKIDSETGIVEAIASKRGTRKQWIFTIPAARPFLKKKEA